MSEITLAVQKEVVGKLYPKTLVVDDRGTFSVDGTIIGGLDGTRALETFFEGVEQDVKELGWAGAEKLFRDMSRKPGRLGKALQASLNISRMLDADRVAGR